MDREKIKKKFKNELKGFRDFALKDNVITLAVGVIIGVAFKDLIDSLVKNIFTPPIGYLTAKLDFSELFIVLGSHQYDTLAQAKEANAVVLQYGLVLNSLLSFLITAIVLYLVIRVISRENEKEQKAEAKKTRECPYCFSEISNKATKCPNCTSAIKPGLRDL